MTLLLEVDLDPKWPKSKRKLIKSFQFLTRVLYLSTCRPDIATAISICGQFAQNPGLPHWKALLRIAAYLATTKNFALQLGGISNEMVLTAYSDADWGGDLNHRRSRTGFVVLLNNSPVVWVSKLQISISLSSTESEYVALSMCAKDVIWARNLLEQIGFMQKNPTTIYEDNGSCIKIAESRKNHPGVKHITIRYHFIRYQIEAGLIKLQQKSTLEMLADTLTKELPMISFAKHRNALKIKDLSSRGSVDA